MEFEGKPLLTVGRFVIHFMAGDSQTQVDGEGLVIDDPDSGKRYSFSCIRCGDCCRGRYVIGIRAEDVERWIADGREDIVTGLRLDMKSIAPAAIIPLGWYRSHPLDPGASEDPFGLEREFLAEHVAPMTFLTSFILENHDHVGDAKAPGEPFVDHWFLPELDYRAILQPHDLDVVQYGLKMHIDYIMNMVFEGACPFLLENNCSIHETKPADCAEYPVKDQLEANERARAYFLETCRGVHEMQSDDDEGRDE